MFLIKLGQCLDFIWFSSSSGETSGKGDFMNLSLGQLASPVC